MRLLLSLTALAVVTLADTTGALDRVLRSWDVSKPVEVVAARGNDSKYTIPYEDDFMVLATQPCLPGYTGDTCTNPICTSENTKVPNVPAIGGTTANVDAAILSNCQQSYALLIDETMSNVRIKLASDLIVNPRFKLQDWNGNTVQEDDIWEETPQLIDMLYFYLPPGIYTVVPAADASVNCYLQVAAHTTMTVVGGFISGDRTYSEKSDQPSTVVYTGTRSSVVVHANNNRSPGALKTIKFMGTQNTYYPPNDLRVRYQCGYEYIWWGFECSVLGDHYFQVEGVTHAGYGFRRIVTFDCLNDYTNATTPASTPATNPKVCHNGGMRVNNLDGSSYCYCLGLWTGNDCSKILCLNGGTQNADNTCQCLDGFNGFHCEQVFCMDISGFGFNADHPTLTFVIRGRQQMNSVVSQVQQAATAYLSNMQFDPNYFNNFILVLFNNNQIIKSGRYIDILDLVNDISSYAKNFTSDGDCTDSVFSAISQALNLFPHNKSPMYVFTDAPPSDSAQIETLIHQLSYWRVPINIVYTPTSPATCPTKVDDPNFWEMDNLAKKSMGAVFSLRNQTQVFDFTYDHLWSTGYRSQLMLSNDDDTCAGQNPYQAVAIESLVDSLTIVATGSNLSLNLTAPETNIAPISVDPYYSDGVNYIWSFNRVTTGTWLININSASSNGPCYYKVYQKSFHGSKNVQYDMFWAFTGAIDSDGPTQQPLFGLDLSISVHLNNYPDFIPPQYVQSALNIYATRNGKQVELYASNGVWRDGCSYNFYFPEFSCPVADETLYFNFYARDELGLPIQRAGVMNCMVYVPTITPPNGCLNGGIPNTDNSTCYCPMGFSGPHCEKLTCFNGGTPIANSTQCRCSNSWTGPFCEIAKCIERGPDPEILMGSVDMVFAVELTLTGQAQIAYLNKNFAELIRDINSQSRTWIRNFVIVGYNSTWGDVMHVTPAGNPEGIIHAMEQIASKDYTDNACTVQLYRALNRAVIRGTTPPGSFIEIFTVTPADQSANGGWSEMYESMRTLYLNVYGYLNIVNPSARNPTGLACNSTYNDYQLLFDLAGGSAGKVYPTQAAMIQDIVKVIPLQYMSSMVYGQVKTDCTEPMQVYFPIDAYTQTILLSVVGNNTKINIYDAQSRSVEYFQFHHDTVSLWDLYEIRKPCDTDWIEVGQYCTYFGKQPKSYDDAHVFCSQAGGFVVDDLTPDKHRFLSENANSMKFWIGLTNMNNNGYVWDRGYNYTQNLNQTNVYWVGGQTPTYDSGKQCVFFNSSAQDQYTWTPDDCATQRPFVCQKHRYDADSPPTDLNSNHLSAGMWYVNITTNSPPGISGVPGCYAEVRIQSKLMIYTGFVTNPAMDFPANDPINSSPENQIIAYIHSEDHDSSTPILKYATLWDAYNGSFYNAMQYQYRVECSFSWISQTFPCPNANSPMNEFGIAHIGEDEFGNMFQRITLAHCTSPVLTCGNGGYRYNGTCVCDEYWTGLFCTIPICVNGGTLSRNDQFCECPTGYAGPNCQFDECRRAVPVSFSPDNRTLILVLEATVQNKPAFTQLANSMAAIIFNSSPGWFKNYALITFDSSGVVYDAYTYTSPQSFQTAIAIQQNVISDPGACQYNLFAILKQALMQVDMIVTPNSQVLMITSSTAADSATRTETIERLSNEEASLHWLYMSNDNCGGAVPSDDSVPHLVKLAYASNGNTAFVKSNNLTDFLTPYLASRYSAQILDNPTANPSNGAAPLTCPSGSWLVEVDMNTTSIFITANSAIGTVGVIAPNGDSINPVTLFNGAEQTQLYRIDTMGSSGIYKIALSSPGMCFLSVWGVGSMGVYTRFAPTSATDLTAAHLDGTAASPSANVNSVAMFHMAGTPGHRGILQYLEVFDVSTQTTILRSELYRRSSCSFEYYSDPFTCQMDIITLYIYGMDESYQPFRRQQMSFCLNGTLSTASPVTVSSTQSLGTTSTTAPATVPSGGTSGPTTTMGSTTTSFGYLNLVFDVVFLVDVSNSANSTYDTMSQFITNLMAGYTVSQDNARVAIIPVPGQSNPFTFAVATLKTITSSNMLTQYLSETKTSFNDFTDAGQSLQSALNQAIKPDFMQKGYRADQPNHLLVYVTSTSTFTDGPSTASILSANNYGIITVGYGAGLDKGALQGISGGSACTFTAATAGDLQSQIPSIKKLIWSANFNGGAYCGNMPAN